MNRTALVGGNSGLWNYLLGTILCFVLGATGLGWALVWPFVFGGPDVDKWLWVMLVAGGAIFTAFGFYSMYRWLRIRSAVKLVKGG